MSTNPPKTIQPWLAQYAEPTADWEWPTQLWKSAWEEGTSNLGGADGVADVALPPRCRGGRGFGWQFDEFGTTGVYVRDEYLRIARGMVDFAAERSGSTLPQEFAQLDITEGLPPNPFLGAGVAMPLTGSPGIGKFLFLHVLLGLRLNAHLPTLLQFNPAECYLFTARGAHRLLPSTISNWEFKRFSAMLPSTWCLIDSNDLMPAPPHVVRHPRAVPPLDWDRRRMSPGKHFYMAPWNATEAILARPLQRRTPLPSARALQRWFTRYVPSALSAYKHAHDPAAYEIELARALECVTVSARYPTCPDRDAPPLFAHAALALKDTAQEVRYLSVENVRAYEVFACYPRQPEGCGSEHGEWRVPTRYLAERVVRALGLEGGGRGPSVNGCTGGCDEMEVHRMFREIFERCPELDAVAACLETASIY
ncbi:hypothetical protein BJ138DRAFT_1118574 [Hygrophoropsis aurantiaca]|uniref:Uncharacterized protein n=1 Tax=Hygrophoropsis aurantiaca TaxID=72124 RepID=A0ACB7ZWR8_9AGAM|nr:hypothetical protein BJ138DRAFT_1118574 [Hygrophoropsis aurantiaca]